MTEANKFYTYMQTPIGSLLIAGDGETIDLISFPTGSRTKHPHEEWQRDDDQFASTRQQLTAYFAGELKEFDVPLTLIGTDFQKSVWRALVEIPFGETISYGELAVRIGKPKASRAVGAANGANPIPVIIPCHRVIGSNKSLTGFGGGVETKAFLLNHEGALGTQASLF